MVLSKKRLSTKQLEQRRQAGKRLAEQRGSSYMTAIGRRGYEVTLTKFPDFHREGGKASWKKRNCWMIKDGYFANQSLEQWDYE